jgi:hypothetical protein
MTPKFSNSVGELRRTPDGTLLEGSHEQTYVSFPLLRKSRERLADEVPRLCAELDALGSILLDFKSTGGKLEFYVSVFLGDRDGGFELDASVIERMNALGLGLAVELYVGP